MELLVPPINAKSLNKARDW